MKYIFSKILLLVLLQLSLYALSIEEAANHTLETNPQIQKSISDYMAITHDLSIAESGYKPKVDLNAAIGPENSDKDRPGDSISLTRKETKLSASQNLFQGFQTEYDIEEQEARIEASRYGVMQDANTVSLRTVEVYIQVLQQKKILDLLLSNVRTHERIYKMIKEKTDAGLSKLSDLEQTHGRLALAYANYISQQNNYQDTIINFEKIFGRMISSSDLHVPSLPTLPSPTQDGLIHIAKEYSPTLIIERSNIETTQSRYGKEKSNFYPKVDLELSGEWNDDLDGVEGKDDSYKAMLKLQYNLYNGGIDEATRLKNMQMVSSHQELLNEQERAVVEKLKLAYMADNILRNQIRCLRIHANQTRKTANAYAQEYQLGRRTLLDLLNTELEYNSAQQSLENAIHEHLFARYRVLESVGILVYTLENSIIDKIDVTEPEAFINDAETQMFELIGETDEFLDMNSICKENEVVTLSEPIEEKIAEVEMIPGSNIPSTEYLYFEYKISDITSVTPDYVNRLVEVLKADKAHNVMILGHTDNIGSKKYNLLLSQKRAETVKRVLVSKGIDASRIKAIGVGEDFPVASNDSEAGRKLNRRVEVSVKKN